MRVFETKWFARFARKEKIEASQLHEAVARAERGSVDADLGGGLVKQRVARRGSGRSGGFRKVIACRAKTRSVSLFGFAKNALDNIDGEDLDVLKKLAKRFLAMSDEDLAKALTAKELIEAGHDDEGD